MEPGNVVATERRPLEIEETITDTKPRLDDRAPRHEIDHPGLWQTATSLEGHDGLGHLIVELVTNLELEPEAPQPSTQVLDTLAALAPSQRDERHGDVPRR